MARSKKPKHILIIRLSAMGDLAMAIPVIYALRKRDPEVRISVLSKPFFRPVIEAIPDITFIPAEVTSRHKGVSGIWKLSRELKKQDVTHIADIHNVLRSKMLLKFMNVKSFQIDKGRAEKKALIDGGKKSLKHLKTTVNRYVEVFKKLDYISLEPLALSRPDKTEVISTFTKKCNRRWLGIAPFAAHLGKQYPLDLMKEVIESLDATCSWDIFLFGSPDEMDTLKDLCSDCVNVHLTAGALNFNEQINLIAQLDTMLSMDSGNGHLAAMYGVPTVTLWGVTHPYTGFAPFNQEAHCITSDRVIYPEIPTSVYGNIVPKGYEEVMRTITPQMVVDKIAALSNSPY